MGRYHREVWWFRGEGALYGSGPASQRGVVIQGVDRHRDKAVVVFVKEQRADDLIWCYVHVT